MLTLQHITYTHPNGHQLFADLNFTLNPQEKIALIGANGVGKSTLLKLMAKQMQPNSGTIATEMETYYLPQVFGQFNSWSIAKALQIEEKLRALDRILEGEVDEQYYETLNNDWEIRERCQVALAKWGLPNLELNRKMDTLSGGEQTKVFLAGITLHAPEIVLLDEPTNHLDSHGRELVYNYISNCREALVVVSHDRELLLQLPVTCELEKNAIIRYGGNYNFYVQQKQQAVAALSAQVGSMEKEVRKAKVLQHKTVERQQKLDARGKRKQQQAGLPTISMKTLKDRAEQSTSKLKDVHREKIEGMSGQLSALREKIHNQQGMKLQLQDMAIHKGKLVIKAALLNYSYQNSPIWKTPLDFELRSGERVALKGSNGSGKSTLIKLLLGSIIPMHGTVTRNAIKWLYIDQHYSLLDDHLSIYQQAQQFNNGSLQEHEISTLLVRFLFLRSDWEKKCLQLSGGERMRLCLCCLAISGQAPDLIMLDEPTNNLDLTHIEILTAALKDYQGTLVVVSHDLHFLNQLNVEREINLDDWTAT